MTVHEKLDYLINRNAFVGTLLSTADSAGTSVSSLDITMPDDIDECFLAISYGHSINNNNSANISGNGLESSNLLIYVQSAGRSLGCTLMIYKIKAAPSTVITIKTVNVYGDACCISAALIK